MAHVEMARRALGELLRRERRFTDPEFVAAWRFMAQLKPYMHPQQSEMSNSDMQILFATGLAAAYPTGSWDIDFLRNTSFAYKKKIDMGVFKPPVESAGQRCHLSVHPDFGIGINKNTKHPEAARKLIDWLEPLLTAIADNSPLLVKGDEASFQNKVHLALNPAPEKPAKKAEN